MGTSAVLQAVNSSTSIRVVAQQAKRLQCDVISCAVYDCFLLESCDISIIQKIICAAQLMVGIENSARRFCQKKESLTVRLAGLGASSRAVVWVIRC